MAGLHDPSTGPIIVLCALAEERRMLVAALTGPRILDRGPIVATGGTLDGVEVVLAESGIGKMHAASTATALIERHGGRALVLSGVAGGVSDELAIGDIVVSRRVIDTDYGRETDAGRIPYQPGSIALPGVEPDAGYELDARLATAIEPQLASIASTATGAPAGRIVMGTIASGDVFVASPRYRDALAERWSADAVEMEGSAICGVAERYGLPWLIVRALSDRAGEESGLDFTAFLPLAAARSAAVVRALLPIVETSTVDS